MNNIIYKEIDIQNISQVKPLWQKLNNFHKLKSIYFKDYLDSLIFEKRIIKFYDKNLKININTAIDKVNDIIIGYCITTIKDNIGEVDSIYVEENYRSQKIGDTLMNYSNCWMNMEGVDSISISVVYGNDDIINFYKKFHFYPALVLFQKK